MTPPDPASLLSQLPATVWTTDTSCVLTSLRSPDLDAAGVTSDRLIGESLARWLDSDGSHPVLRAHHEALAGRESALVLEWGNHRLSGRVAPLRDARGAVIGVVGLLQRSPVQDAAADEECLVMADGTAAGAVWVAPPGPVNRALASALEMLADEFDMDGALLWRLDRGRPRLLAGTSGALGHQAVAEPFAWLAASTGSTSWTDSPGLFTLPLGGGTDGAMQAVLALVRDLGPEPSPLEARRIAIAARPLLHLGATRDIDELGDDEGDEVDEIHEDGAEAAARVEEAPPGEADRRSWSGVRVAVLAGCLVPLPLLLSACRLAP